MTVATTVLPAQPALGLHLPRAHQHHAVAVDHPAVLVGEDRAVAVAVERHAGNRRPRSTTRAAIASGCVEPQPRLMLRPSGDAPISVDVEAERREDPGRHAGRRAVGAVDDQRAPRAKRPTSGSTSRRWPR